MKAHVSIILTTVLLLQRCSSKGLSKIGKKPNPLRFKILVSGLEFKVTLTQFSAAIRVRGRTRVELGLELG